MKIKQYFKDAIQTLITILIVLSCYSCKKDEIVEPQTVGRSDSAICINQSFKMGVWSGTMTYEIKGVVNQTIKILRQFRRNNGYTVQWFDYPISIDTISIINDGYDISMYMQFNGECNGIPADTAYFNLFGSGWVVGDTLYESGRLDYVIRYNGIVLETTGKFKSKLTYWRELYN